MSNALASVLGRGDDGIDESKVDKGRQDKAKQKQRATLFFSREDQCQPKRTGDALSTREPIEKNSGWGMRRSISTGEKHGILDIE